MTTIDRVALAIVGLVLLTMPVFAVVGRGRAVDAEVARRPTTVLLGFWIRDWAMWVLGPSERALVRWKVSPDVFNYLGAFFGLLAGVAFYFGELSVAGWMILLGGAMDIFDGRIARARNLANARGAFLDSTLDRFSETFAFAGVAMFFVDWPLALLAAVLALGGSMLVSYARARGEALGVSCKEGLMQRAERLVLLALASLFDGVVTSAAGWSPGGLLFGVVAVIAVGSLWTAAYRTAHISAQLGDQSRERL